MCGQQRLRNIRGLRNLWTKGRKGRNIAVFGSKSPIPYPRTVCVLALEPDDVTAGVESPMMSLRVGVCTSQRFSANWLCQKSWDRACEYPRVTVCGVVLFIRTVYLVACYRLLIGYWTFLSHVMFLIFRQNTYAKRILKMIKTIESDSSIFLGFRSYAYLIRTITMSNNLDVI